MPIPRQTRKDIRRSIGHDLQGALDGGMVIRHASEFTSTTITDPGLIGGTSDGRGRHVVIAGHLAVVTAFNPDDMVITFAPLHPDPPPDGEYELWDEKFDPSRINALINQAITDAEASGVLCEEVLDLVYLPPYSNRIKAPDDWIALVAIERSNTYSSYGYIDLLHNLQADDDSESDDVAFPFHTVKLAGSHDFTLDYDFGLGIYDSIGWEVTGHFSGKSEGEGRGRFLATEEWGFVKQDFNYFTASKDSDGNPIISYEAGTYTYVIDAYLYRESETVWHRVEFIIWPQSREIEIGYGGSATYSYGSRLRLHGAKRLSLLDSEEAVPEVPASFIRTQALISLLRGVPQVLVDKDGREVRQEWERRAEREYAQLPRLQQVRYLE